MPKLIVQNLAGRVINVSPDQKVLAALKETDIDWMQACGGKGRCTTCRMIVLNGMANFGELSLPEQKYQRQGRLKENERLACQSYLIADALVQVPRETQFPNVNYAD